jgi:hypothetical protein
MNVPLEEAKVGLDCHVVFKGSFYSVPDKYALEGITIRATLKKVELYHKCVCIKVHSRAQNKGHWETDITDLNDKAQHYLKNTPSVCLAQAKLIGVATYLILEDLLQHPSNTRLRKAQAILRLAEEYGAERLEAACERGLQHSNIKYETIRRILENALDKVPAQALRELSTEELTQGAF